MNIWLVNLAHWYPFDSFEFLGVSRNSSEFLGVLFSFHGVFLLPYDPSLHSFLFVWFWFFTFHNSAFCWWTSLRRFFLSYEKRLQKKDYLQTWKTFMFEMGSNLTRIFTKVWKHKFLVLYCWWKVLGNKSRFRQYK